MNFDIKDPPGLKGGPGAQMKALQKHLREYYGPFRVQGDNPPVVIAKDGEALLSMMWPVHDQTPEGEQAAVEYTKGLAQQIADGLNKSAELQAKLDASEQREAELAAWQTEIRGAIERSGMGIMRTSQGPSGTMLGYRPEVEEEHDRKTLEVIHKNVDLTVKLRKAKEREAELRRAHKQDLMDLLDLVRGHHDRMPTLWNAEEAIQSRLTAILKGEQP